MCFLWDFVSLVDHFQKYCQLCRLFSAIRKSLIDEQFEPLFVTVTVNLWLNKGGEKSLGPTDLEPRGLKTPGNVARSFIVPLQRVHLELQRARLTDYSLMYKFGIAQFQRPPPVAKRLLAVVELHGSSWKGEFRVQEVAGSSPG